MSWEPLFFSDPERFIRSLGGQEGQDELARQREYRCVQDYLFGEIYRYGYFNDAEMIAPLGQFYQMLLEHDLATDKRLEVCRHIGGVLTETKSIRIDALMPFICWDPDRAVVSTATVDYVSLGSLFEGDPMSRPKELIRLIGEGGVRNPGAVFGGLLVLGDPRLCKLLWPLKETLSPQGAKEAAQCTSGVVSAATIEFVIDWLEGLEGTGDDALFGDLASHLILQRRHMQTKFVTTGLRPFPVTSVSDEEFRAMLQLIPAAAYVDRIAPRLLALERAEPEPKVIPLVLREWGIGPDRLA
jgi:hypothetical protein